MGVISFQPSFQFLFCYIFLCGYMLNTVNMQLITVKIEEITSQLMFNPFNPKVIM